MIDHLSASQINLYLQCGLKYRFQYIDQLPRTFKSSGLVFGSCVHSCISWFHKQRLAGKPVTVEQLCRMFEADWFSHLVEADVRYKKEESEAGLLMLGKEIMSLYFHQTHNGVKGSEIPFVVPLVNPSSGQETGVNLEGFIDLIEGDDTIVEFKTSLRAYDAKDVDEQLQLTAYSYAFQMLNGRLPPKLKVVNFVKTKKPKMLNFETQRTRKDHQRFFYLAREILKGIRSQVFIPRASWMCTDCEYREPCAHWS